MHLATVKKLAPSSLGLAAAALRFLYQVTLKKEGAVKEIPFPKAPVKLPVILSRQEVSRFLQSVASPKHRTILTTIYATGLRISEATHLKVTDIDSQRMIIRVEGKGRKDRYRHAFAQTPASPVHLWEGGASPILALPC